MSHQTDPPIVKKARSFAIQAHGEQRYGAHPYTLHLDAVAQILRLADFGPKSLILAYLHDVVEDTIVTIEEIQERFGADIAQCVGLLTDAPGETRAERKKTTYAKLALVPKNSPQSLALIVKAADRLANFRACLQNQHARLTKVYQDEHPTFRAAAFRADNSAAKIWEELDGLIQKSRPTTDVFTKPPLGEKR